MQQAGYHQANMIASKISIDLQEQLSQQDTQLLSILQTLTTSEQENIPPTQSVACANMQPNATQLESLKVVQKLRTDLQNMRSQENTLRKPNPQSDGSSTKKFARKTPDTGGRFRKIIAKYCWTRDACAHESKNCPDKSPGHQNNAMFDNKMGGSVHVVNRGVSWVHVL